MSQNINISYSHNTIDHARKGDNNTEFFKAMGNALKATDVNLRAVFCVLYVSFLQADGRTLIARTELHRFIKHICLKISR